MFSLAVNWKVILFISAIHSKCWRANNVTWRQPLSIIHL